MDNCCNTESTFSYRTMNSKVFHFSEPFISHTLIDSFRETSKEKEILSGMIHEWNTRICIADLSKKWKKERPTHNNRHNILILLFNVEGLYTHITDVDVLLQTYKPHMGKIIC